MILYIKAAQGNYSTNLSALYKTLMMQFNKENFETSFPCIKFTIIDIMYINSRQEQVERLKTNFIILFSPWASFKKNLGFMLFRVHLHN